MKQPRRLFVFAALLSAVTHTAFAAKKTSSSDAVKEELAYTLGVEAFIYGFPLVETYRARDAWSLNKKNAGFLAPMNQFAHFDRPATGTETLLITPNKNTLYSIATLDLSAEPIIVRVPRMGSRWFTLQCIDAYGESLYHLGTLRGDTNGGSYAFVGPGWQGTLPEGLERIEWPGRLAFVCVRILAETPADLGPARESQKNLRLTPASTWGKGKGLKAQMPDYPPYDAAEPLNFFKYLNLQLADNPPRPADAGIISLIEQIGLGAGRDFNPATLDPPVAAGLRRALRSGMEIAAAVAENTGLVTDTWGYADPDARRFGTNYLLRLGVTYKTLHSATGMKTTHTRSARSESQRYILHFESEKLEKDKYECYVQAKKLSGFDPVQLPTVSEPPPPGGPGGSLIGGVVGGAVGGALVGLGIGALAGDAGKGAAIGAAGGAMLGGVARGTQQHRHAADEERWARNQMEGYSGERNAYDQAYGACLEERGYPVQ